MSPAETNHAGTSKPLPLAGMLAIALLVAAASPAAAADWRLEPIPASEGVQVLGNIGFDTNGRALLSWSAALRGRVPPSFGGLASRDPAGGWQRPPDFAGVEPAEAQVHLLGQLRALLVGREYGSIGDPGSNRRRLVVADGQSDGGFGPLQTLDDFTLRSWSAANRRGDAIIAWTGERSPFVRVAVRAFGRMAFALPRDLALATTAAVAVSPRGDFVLVFPVGKRLGVRVRPAGGIWGPIVEFGRLGSVKDLRLSALFPRDDRIVVTWGSAGRDCGVAVRGPGVTWRTRRLERRCGPSAVGPRDAPVLPFADDRGATYVAWTGRARNRRDAVKLARIDAAGRGATTILSRQRGAVLDDVAAGPNRALAVTWTAPRPLPGKPYITATFCAVSRNGAFARGDRLTPPNVVVARGSRVAFQPLTGEPVVAVPFSVGYSIAVGAAIGPPAAQPSR